MAIVVGVIKMGKIMPRAGIGPTSQAFWASVLPLRHVGSVMSPLCLRLPVYAASCLIGQCRQYNSATGIMIQYPLCLFVLMTPKAQKATSAIGILLWLNISVI